MSETELPFEPDSDEDLPAPDELTDDERKVAALRTVYEVQRALLGLAAAVDYLAELAGVTEEELRAVTRRAEEDELADLGVDDLVHD